MGRLSKYNGSFKQYDDIIRQYLVSNHAEGVTQTMKKSNNRIVYKEVLRGTSLTSKLRVLFDASSHGSG